SGSYTSRNDLAAGTRIRSITISDPNYAISEAVAGANGVTLLEGLVYNATSSGASFTVPIALGANQTFYSANAAPSVKLCDLNLGPLQTLTIDGRGVLDFEGVVSGTGGLTKLGDGTTILAGSNTFEGLVDLNQGVINLRNNNALGSTNAGTIAGLGTSIQVQ